MSFPHGSPAPTDRSPDGALTARDRTLVECVRRGEESAVEAIFAEYYDPLCRFAYGYVRSRAQAEEIVADVFLALWRQRALWQPTAGVARYLYGAVRNRALNEIRHARVSERWSEREAGEVVALDQHLVVAAAEERLVEADLAALVHGVVAQMPPRTRRVFELR
jgi:RNA polymerase sigma-70 factor (ECF subfamily)